MFRQTRRPIAILLAGLLAALSVAAQESTSTLTTAGTSPAGPEPLHQWLDEVRAQRQIREERRRAAKEAMDAHRRWIDPWGTAQKEVREQENQRRRKAFMEHIERDRETLRNQIPWRFEPGPWQQETHPLPAQPPSSPGADALDITGQTASSASPFALPGWDNRWYYRGY